MIRCYSNRLQMQNKFFWNKWNRIIIIFGFCVGSHRFVFRSPFISPTDPADVWLYFNCTTFLTSVCTIKIKLKANMKKLNPARWKILNGKMRAYINESIVVVAFNDRWSQLKRHHVSFNQALVLVHTCLIPSKFVCKLICTCKFSLTLEINWMVKPNIIRVFIFVIILQKTHYLTYPLFTNSGFVSIHLPNIWRKKGNKY